VWHSEELTSGGSAASLGAGPSVGHHCGGSGQTDTVSATEMSVLWIKGNMCWMCTGDDSQRVHVDSSRT
jgi:hypothetical protein